MRRGQHRRLPSWAVGLIAVVIIVAGFYLAFNKDLPFGSAYEVRAVVRDAQTLAVGSPVRIAGVNVGEVTAVQALEDAEAREGEGEGEGGAAVVTMELSDEGRPIHTDASLQLRPRLFLEGNYFIELRPGSPSAPEAGDGYTIPLTATASTVQLDQVLTTLQKPVREDLRVVLFELARTLGEGGAEGLRRVSLSAPAALRATSRVNEALLGTAPRDLSGLVRNLGRVAEALARNEDQLADLVTNLDTVSGALASESTALEQTVARLPGTLEAAEPALRAVNGSLPAARAFAIEALPGVRTLPGAIDEAIPLLRQLRGLLSPAELRGLLADLRPGVPHLTRLVLRSEPLLAEARALTSCFSEVVIPWANSTVPDPETPASGKIFEETAYGLVGINGESRSADGNGPYARVLGGGGLNTVVFPPFGGFTENVVGVTPQPILGARPSLDSSAKTPFRPDVRCETNEPPDLDSGDAGAPPPQQPTARAGSAAASPALRARIGAIAAELEEANRLIERIGPGSSDRRARDAATAARGAIEELNRVLAEAFGWEALLAQQERNRASGGVAAGGAATGGERS